MTIAIEYEPSRDLTETEEMTVYSIEKLLSGMTIESVHQVLGKVVTRMKSTAYKPPLNRFACGDWDEAVLRTVKDNIDKVAGEVAKKISDAKTSN